jgi:beta-galactosidase
VVVKADVAGALAGSSVVRASLFRPNEAGLKGAKPVAQAACSVVTTVAPGGGGGGIAALPSRCCVLLPLDDPDMWSAESPSLYTLVVELVPAADDDGGGGGGGDDYDAPPHQVECCRVGVRDVSIVDGQLRVNGAVVTVRGVNRHDHDERRGKAVPRESMLEDVLLMKRFNFNALRCSHYPNDEHLLRLCDEYGLYCCDEANIETHGMMPMRTLSRDAAWEEAYMARCRYVTNW